MLSADFQERLNEALINIVGGVYSSWLTWGKQDFPHDEGVAFRNEFIKFTLGFIHELNNPIGRDEHVSRLFGLMEELTPLEIVRVIGLLHSYVTAWDACRGTMDDNGLKKALDWLYNSYGLPAQQSVEWFNLTRQNRDEFPVEHGKRKMFREIAVIVGTDPDDDRAAGGLSGLAFIIKHGHNYDEADHTEWCRRVFE